jgi:hypothetical protein
MDLLKATPAKVTQHVVAGGPREEAHTVVCIAGRVICVDTSPNARTRGTDVRCPGGPTRVYGGSCC